MKKSLLVGGILVSSFAFAAPHWSEIPLEQRSQEQENKIRIEPDLLPDPVKASIALDKKVKYLSILETWQWPTTNGNFHFKVIFEDRKKNKLVKEYDQDGNEMKE